MPFNNHVPDSIPIESLKSVPDKKNTKPNINLKVLISLFVIFMFIVSDVFTNYVIANIPGTVNCRLPTTYGTVIQAIFLVIFFVLINYLIDTKII